MISETPDQLDLGRIINDYDYRSASHLSSLGLLLVRSSGLLAMISFDELVRDFFLLRANSLCIFIFASEKVLLRA